MTTNDFKKKLPNGREILYTVDEEDNLQRITFNDRVVFDAEKARVRRVEGGAFAFVTIELLGAEKRTVLRYLVAYLKGRKVLSVFELDAEKMCIGAVDPKLTKLYKSLAVVKLGLKKAGVRLVYDKIQEEDRYRTQRRYLSKRKGDAVTVTCYTIGAHWGCARIFVDKIFSLDGKEIFKYNEGRDAGYHFYLRTLDYDQVCLVKTRYYKDTGQEEVVLVSFVQADELYVPQSTDVYESYMDAAREEFQVEVVEAGSNDQTSTTETETETLPKGGSGGEVTESQPFKGTFRMEGLEEFKRVLEAGCDEARAA